jgi:hypothetical protein
LLVLLPLRLSLLPLLLLESSLLVGALCALLRVVLLAVSRGPGSA